jgi:hypothetical protein
MSDIAEGAAILIAFTLLIVSSIHFKCPKKPREYTLRAKVVCGCCRHAMQIAPRKERAFVCRYTRVNENAECYKLEIVEQELESLLFEIINKQAQVILNIDGLGDTANLSLKIEQQTEYEKQIEKCREEKCNLYEQYVLRQLDAEAYKKEKSALDADLSRLNRAFGVLKKETAVMLAAKASDDELRNLAENAIGTGKLSRSLMDLLIDKVYVYPGNRVEIKWKVADYGIINGEVKRNAK